MARDIKAYSDPNYEAARKREGKINAIAAKNPKRAARIQARQARPVKPAVPKRPVGTFNPGPLPPGMGTPRVPARSGLPSRGLPIPGKPIGPLATMNGLAGRRTPYTKK